MCCHNFLHYASVTVLVQWWSIARLLVKKCSFKLKVLMLSITAALSTFTSYFESNFTNTVTFYFYLSKLFGLKMIQYLYFYSNTQGKVLSATLVQKH